MAASLAALAAADGGGLLRDVVYHLNDRLISNAQLGGGGTLQCLFAQVVEGQELVAQVT